MHMHVEIILFVMGAVSFLHREGISELWHSNSQFLPFLKSSAQGESEGELLALCSSTGCPECLEAAAAIDAIQTCSCPTAFLAAELQLPNFIPYPAGFLYPLLWSLFDT